MDNVIYFGGSDPDYRKQFKSVSLLTGKDDQKGDGRVRSLQVGEMVEDVHDRHMQQVGREGQTGQHRPQDVHVDTEYDTVV